MLSGDRREVLRAAFFPSNHHGYKNNKTNILLGVDLKDSLDVKKALVLSLYAQLRKKGFSLLYTSQHLPPKEENFFKSLGFGESAIVLIKKI